MSSLFQKHRKQGTQSQAGVASLMVTMMLMIVVSLIVLGFAQVSRREQRSTLDRQLSTQAFYAAETGVNDAKKVIISAGGIPTDKSTCPTDSSSAEPYKTLNSTLSDDVAYTCLLVSSRNPTVESTVAANGDWVVPLSTIDNSTGNPTPATSFTVTWKPSKDVPTNPANNCPTTAGTNPAVTAWACGFGLLRLDLVPTTAADGSSLMSRDQLLASDMVSFIYPLRSGGGSTNYSAGASQPGAACSAATNTCTITISGLPGARGYYARVHMMYKDSGNVAIAAKNGGATLLFANAQAIIDSTGKAQDVLRRIQVRMPLTNSSSNFPAYAVQTRDTICKRYTLTPTTFTDQCPAP